MQFGYPHELGTPRLLAAHARDHGPNAGHSCLAQLAQGTVCRILAAHEVKPHKVRYCLERRDPEFEPKWLKFDEKPGVRAIGTTTPDLRLVPAAHPTICRDHEYKRHGTVTLMAGIDLLTGQVHALVKDRHRSREFIEFLGLLDAAPTLRRRRLRSSSTITRRTSPKKPGLGWRPDLTNASNLCSRPSTASGSILSRASLLKLAFRPSSHPRHPETRTETPHHRVH
jgi:hypothetical protein